MVQLSASGEKCSHPQCDEEYRGTRNYALELLIGKLKDISIQQKLKVKPKKKINEAIAAVPTDAGKFFFKFLFISRMYKLCFFLLHSS